jgi:hypothetical protein
LSKTLSGRKSGRFKMIFTKYNILIILCLPILILFLIRIYDGYKRNKISFRGLIILLLFLIILSFGILFNKQFFNYFETTRLTDSTPLSLYDVIQIVAIIALIYQAFRQTYKIENLQNKLSRLNQEIALKYARNKKK